MKFKSLITLVALSLTSPVAVAQAALFDFSSTMSSFSAEFTQTVYDSDSVALQESAGIVELMRPGRFRWTYTEPASQVIVADGVTLWVYDEDIKQVTVQPQSATLGAAPIGLLSGERTIESEFDVTEVGTEKGLQWFELKPLVQDTDFNAVYIALDSNGLHAMELRDNFDQATQIKFSNFKKNIAIEDERFTFEPPDGTDVVGEMGIAGGSDKLPDETVKTLPADLDKIDTATQEVEPADSGLPPIVEGEPIPESSTVIDGNQLQIQEITE